MTARAATGTFNTNDALTVGQLRQALEDNSSVLAELPGGATVQSLTITAGGSLTPVAAAGAMIKMDTFGGASSDDLISIDQAVHPDGRILFLRTADNARDVTVKHNDAGGTYKILLNSGLDLLMNNTQMLLGVYRDGSVWRELLIAGRETPIPFSFQNSWGVYTFEASGSTFHYKDVDGNTNLSGTILKGSVTTAGQVVIQLPFGRRPLYTQRRLVHVTVNGVYELGILELKNDGDVEWIRPSGVAVSSQPVVIQLGGISFRS